MNKYGAWNVLENLLKDDNAMFVILGSIEEYKKQFSEVVGLEIDSAYIGNNVYRLTLKVIK